MLIWENTWGFFCTALLLHRGWNFFVDDLSLTQSFISVADIWADWFSCFFTFNGEKKFESRFVWKRERKMFETLKWKWNANIWFSLFFSRGGTLAQKSPERIPSSPSFFGLDILKFFQKKILSFNLVLWFPFDVKKSLNNLLWIHILLSR